MKKRKYKRRKKLIGRPYREDALTGMLKTSGFRIIDGESVPHYHGFAMIRYPDGHRYYYDGGLGRTCPEATKDFLDEVHRLLKPFDKRERRIAYDKTMSQSKHYSIYWELADGEMDGAVDDVLEQCPVLESDSVMIVIFSEKWSVHTPLMRVFVASHKDLRI